VKISQVRRFALSLPEVTEEPHFDKSSFRVRGRIFATVPPGASHLHVFVDEVQRQLMVSVAPEAHEKLWWGKKVVGLRVALSLARPQDVKELLQSAWQQKAPTSLVRSLTRGRRIVERAR
jgi:hypothetical protein